MILSTLCVPDSPDSYRDRDCDLINYKVTEYRRVKKGTQRKPQNNLITGEGYEWGEQKKKGQEIQIGQDPV